jgi:hypothetical protein
VPRRHREIWYALAAAAAVTALYAVAYQQAGAFPAASGLVGHGIGVVGFVLMLMTETLYSVRKQLTDARWGSMAGWLRFHIVTGLVGPYMVLLHTSMRFAGLAGVVMLLTVVVVASGVVGRYVYTALPRTVVGSEPRVSVPDGGIATVEASSPVSAGVARLSAERGALATWYAVHVPLTWVLFVTAFVHVVGALYYATLQR